jgi:hypothetical protein
MNETETAVSPDGPRYEFGVAEPKWQRAWAERNSFGVADVPAKGKRVVKRIRVLNPIDNFVVAG